jgi:hypothetical protein
MIMITIIIVVVKSFVTELFRMRGQRRVVKSLLSYPEDIQRLILKAEHFPLPSQEAYLLLHLYLNNTTSLKNAIQLLDVGRQKEKREILKKLVKQGHIKEKEESYLYLTDEGITIAKGTLRIFPELEKQRMDVNNHRS